MQSLNLVATQRRANGDWYQGVIKNGGLDWWVAPAPDWDRSAYEAEERARGQLLAVLDMLRDGRFDPTVGPSDGPDQPVQEAPERDQIESDPSDGQIALLREAIRLTREYVGPAMLPAVEGWSWFDAVMATGGVEEFGTCGAPLDPDVHGRSGNRLLVCGLPAGHGAPHAPAGPV